MGALVAFMIVSFGAFGILADESDAGGHAYYDIDLGNRILEIGQVMEIDLADKMVMMNRYSGGSYTDMSVSSNLPSWIEVVSNVGEGSPLSNDSDVRIIIKPQAISAGDYKILFDTERTFISSTTALTFTVNVNITTVAANSTNEPVILTFDSGEGFSDISKVSYTLGSSISLPGAELTGMLFMGWYDGEEHVGGEGDVITPTGDITLTAAWEKDPDYVSPDAYDHIYSAILIGIIVLIAAVIIIKGRA